MWPVVTKKERGERLVQTRRGRETGSSASLNEEQIFKFCG